MDPWTEADVRQLLELMKIAVTCAWLIAVGMWVRIGWSIFYGLIAKRKL